MTPFPPMLEETGWLMSVAHSGDRVFLAWLDTTGDADVVLTYPSGGADDAVAKLPWLHDAMRPGVPVCAYAVIVDARIRSVYLLHPRADDVARLDAEFRALAFDVAGSAAAPLVTMLRERRHDAIEIAVVHGRALRGGSEVALSDGEFAVLTTMALHRRTMNREELCDTLWPDRDLESASRLLKVYVHRIRTKFDTTFIIDTHGGGYRLGAGVSVDFFALEALVRAASAEPVAIDGAEQRVARRGFDGIIARGYARLGALDAFPDLERRLLAMAADLARILVADAFAHDDAGAALAIAHDLAAIDPFDYVAAELLIRTQLRLGRHDAASRHYSSFCRTLREELDLPPPRHLSQLLEA